MIENPECNRLYSIRGNWVYGWGYPGDEEIPDLIQRWNKEARKILFIDRDTRESESYIKSKKGFEYITVSEFITKYNKNPRKYEKK